MSYSFENTIQTIKLNSDNGVCNLPVLSRATNHVETYIHIPRRSFTASLEQSPNVIGRQGHTCCHPDNSAMVKTIMK